MRSIAVLLSLLQNFYHVIPCDKSRNFVHAKTFEVQHEIYRFQARSLKYKQNPLRIFNFQQIFSIWHQICVFDDNVNFCKLLDWNFLFIECFKSIAVFWNILRLFLSVNKVIQRVWWADATYKRFIKDLAIE